MTGNTFNADNFKTLIDVLAQRDADLAAVINQYGYPPMWNRPANFSTLVLIILEQQVSLAAAFAAFKKLKDKLGIITPKKLLQLTDEDMRSCYFTRQKMHYARELAKAINTKKLSLKSLYTLPDEEVRSILKQHKGIGDWTADIYLLHALQRVDIFPTGDLALVKSLIELKQLPAATTVAELLQVAEKWRPYRTLATMLLWHRYICKKNLKVLY